MSDPSGDIDARLTAALERVGEAMRVQLWDAARRLGLTPTQVQILLRLRADPPEHRRVGALASRLDVTHPTISDGVSALTRKGLVERESEGRRAPLALTARGREPAAEAAGWSDPIRDRLAELGEADKEVALGLVFDLIAGLQRDGVITVTRMCATCRFFRPEAHPGEPRPHHCALLEIPLAETELRIDCPEHQPA